MRTLPNATLQVTNAIVCGKNRGGLISIDETKHTYIIRNVVELDIIEPVYLVFDKNSNSICDKGLTHNKETTKKLDHIEIKVALLKIKQGKAFHYTAFIICEDYSQNRCGDKNYNLDEIYNIKLKIDTSIDKTNVFRIDFNHSNLTYEVYNEVRLLSPELSNALIFDYYSNVKRLIKTILRHPLK